MSPFLIVLLGAFLWGTIVQQIAERRGAPNTTRAYPALVQAPYVIVWLLGVLALVLIVYGH